MVVTSCNSFERRIVHIHIFVLNPLRDGKMPMRDSPIHSLLGAALLSITVKVYDDVEMAICGSDKQAVFD